jgi:hypothetical protein
MLSNHDMIMRSFLRLIIRYGSDVIPSISHGVLWWLQQKGLLDRNYNVTPKGHTWAWPNREAP